MPGCPDDLLDPEATWRDRAAYERAAKDLLTAFEASHASWDAASD